MLSSEEDDSVNINQIKSDSKNFDPISQLKDPPNMTRKIFSCTKPNHKNKPIKLGVYESARLCQVYQLNHQETRTIHRGGIIPYTYIDDELYICFGRDRMHGDLTDFGGTKKPGEHIVECAIREGEEESRLVFGKITPDQVKGFWCLHNSRMLIIFIPVKLDDSNGNQDIIPITQENFNKKLFLTEEQANTDCYNELSSLTWLNEYQLANVFSERPNRKMFQKVRRFLYSSGEFHKESRKLKEFLRETYLSGLSPESEKSSPQIQRSSEKTVDNLKQLPDYSLRNYPCEEDEEIISPLRAQPLLKNTYVPMYPFPFASNYLSPNFWYHKNFPNWASYPYEYFYPPNHVPSNQ